MKLIINYTQQLHDLCQKYHVATMYVFGSVATDSFSSDSDIDFLVKFSEIDPLEHFDNYIDFKESLEHLFSRDVDLVEMQTLKNPILKRSVDRDKILVYEREDTEVAI